MAIVEDIEFYKSEDITILGHVDNAPGGIAGWTLAFTIRDEFDGPIILQKTTLLGITITDPPNANYSIEIDSADTINLPPRVRVFDVSRTDTGNDTVLSIGKCIIKPEVTN